MNYPKYEVRQKRAETNRRKIFACMYSHLSLGDTVTMRQITAETGIKSTSTISRHIKHMVDLGWITHGYQEVTTYQLTGRARVDMIEGKAVIVEVVA